MNTDFYQQIDALGDTTPPVEQWQPPLSGDMDCVIRRDGSWWIDGSELSNRRLARLFSTVLKCEGNDYFLMTPVEKWRIQVQDLPLLVVSLDVREAGEPGQCVDLRTNMGDELTIDKQHEIENRPLPGATPGDSPEVPCVRVRGKLFARFNRNTHLQLAEYLEAGEAPGCYTLRSAGRCFELQFRD